MRLFFAVLFASIVVTAFSQDIYDKDNSLKYLHYLEDVKEYELLYPEFERLIYMEPDNDSLKLGLLRAFQKAGWYERGAQRTESFFPDRVHMPVAFADQYIKLLILDKSFEKAIAFDTTTQGLTPESKSNYQITIYLLNCQWKQAQQFSKKTTVSQRFNPILQDIEHTKYKSPLLATGMSVVIPGLGKVYSKRWRDGIISFITVSVLAWQSYVGFHKKGVESVYGWFAGTVGTGFYLGNIYGSYKAAKHYNEDRDNELLEKVHTVTINKY